MIPTPPRRADQLLTWFCASHLLEEIQGDLYERYCRDVQQRGQSAANRRYWINVLRFIRPFAIKRRPDDYPSLSSLHPTMLRNYFSTSLRTLTKNKVSTLINLVGLIFGVTSCLLIYFITSYELRYDTFHPDADRIYRLVGEAQFNSPADRHPVGFVPNAVPAAIRKEIAGLETVAAFHNIRTDVLVPHGNEKPTRFESSRHSEIVVVEPQYFTIFTHQWLAGNPRTALSEPFQVVLSEQKARTYFGDAPPDQLIGRQLIYQDSIRVSVTGIVKSWSQPSDLTFTDFISFATIKASQLKREIDLSQWEDIWSASQAYVKLPAGSNSEQFAPLFEQFSKKHYAGKFIYAPALQPLADLHFNEDYQDNYTRKAHLPTLYGLMAVAGFILLIAAINFINLSTARSTQRAKETGIRKVMGGSRRSLILQFMSETALLTFIAILVALALVKPIVAGFSSFVPPGLSIDLFTLQTGLFILGLMVVTSLLAGFYPAWMLSSHTPALVLRGQSALGYGHRGNLRKTLIIFQFTISLVFIISTVMVGRQLNFMRSKDLGFSTAMTLEIRPPRGNREKGVILAQQVRQLAGVERVTMEWFPPMGDAYMQTKMTYQPPKKPAVETEVSAKVGDENFIPLYQLRLLAGRNYVKSGSLRELVINAAYAKALGFQRPADALNQQIGWEGKKYPIVGVVADFHEQSFHEKISPAFIAYMPDQARNIGIKLNAKSADELKTVLSSLERQWQDVFHDNKFDYAFLDDSVAKLYEKEQKTGQLVNTATGLAILISCMGLFGLARFTAEQRTKEIGVRKTLGASVNSILILLSKDFLKLVLIALLIASPIAWWAMREWLSDFAYKVAIDWWVFALAGLLSVGITLLTISFQSIRAALANPVKALRTE